MERNALAGLGFATPLGAVGGEAQIIGYDEVGNPIYQDVLGHTYSVGPQPQRSRELERLLGLPDDPQTPAGINLLGLLSGFTAPGNALRGQMVTVGDVWDTAGTASLGASAMPAPQNALRAMNVWTGGNGNPIRAASDRGAWFAETPELAREYAAQGGRVMAAEIDPQNPIFFRHAEQRRTIGDVISTALEGARSDVNFDAARPIVERLSQRYGTEPRPLFEYWNKDKDVADLFRTLGYDAISAAEKADMNAATWAALSPKIIRMIGTE